MDSSISAAILAQQLKAIPVFSDLGDEDLAWLAERMEVVHFNPGDVIATEGSPADRMWVVLEGEVRGRRERVAGDGRTYSARAPQVTGLLPYSRLTQVPLTTRAMAPTTIASLHASRFPEMLQYLPSLGPKLVGVMADRIRETTKADQQREKLTALGKLSAGIAHELNNPASAVRNAAISLQDTVKALRTSGLHLDQRDLCPEDRTFLAQIECNWSKDHPPEALDSLERSDREELIGDWLEGQCVPNARQLAPDLVDAGCDLETLRSLSARFNGEILADAITRLTASFTLNRLVEQIERGTLRISDLVRAIKQYSYMDQAPEQELDVHEGLENTLIMLHYRLKHGVEVIREYDRAIPRICARGNELNQVWTNLIDNAIDAMGGRGELLVRTAPEFGGILVEIRDNGPGIPAEIRDRIFEPFFTTKQVGEGTGLGLDTVYRIVQRHRGQVLLESEPGRTSFQVRLPYAATRAGDRVSDSKAADA
jgi:signal transduction histidine kinase